LPSRIVETSVQTCNSSSGLPSALCARLLWIFDVALTLDSHAVPRRTKPNVLVTQALPVVEHVPVVAT